MTHGDADARWRVATTASAAEHGRRGQIDGATSGHRRHPTQVKQPNRSARAADSYVSPPGGPSLPTGPARQPDGAPTNRGSPAVAIAGDPRPRPHHFISLLPCPPLLISSLLPPASKRHPNRQRQRAATATTPLELSSLASTPLKRAEKASAGQARGEEEELGGEGSAMASNGDGKGRVAAAGGGYGYGYGYGGYEGPEDRKWWPWLVPTVIVACIAVFVVEMYENNCPKHGSPLGDCVAGFLRRFSFQPLRENPLLGPSSSTYVFRCASFCFFERSVLPRVPNRTAN
ncbi:hypothetical protein HU200_033837 [Digitaria exilis]|uniref:Rhomboid-like protein n=1 Tax=Digitaria exilis TaxID=1010633 RepID=A0A835EN17_9POAL|nr:hypothetical protein HU200_033837 [Digitaria exilis]